MNKIDSFISRTSAGGNLPHIMCSFDADCAVRVDGCSMYPRYSSGDLLALKVLDSPTFIQWGRPHVLKTSQGCVVKRLFPDPVDDTKIVCHSEDCRNYPDFKIDKKDVLGIALVVGRIGTE